MNDSNQKPRRWLLAAGATAAVAGAGFGLWRFAPQAVDAPASHPLWGLEFDTPGGDPLRMASFRGKPLLLNFWATWCPPCVEELPMISAFWRENVANGFQVVALAIDQPSVVRRFMGQHELAFPVGLAGLSGTSLAKSLGNAAGGLPFTVFFKADGSIWQQKMGQLKSDDLTAWRASSGT